MKFLLILTLLLTVIGCQEIVSSNESEYINSHTDTLIIKDDLIKDTLLITCEPNGLQKDTLKYTTREIEVDYTFGSCPIVLTTITVKTFTLNKCMYQEITNGVVTNVFVKIVKDDLLLNCESEEVGAFNRECLAEKNPYECAYDKTRTCRETYNKNIVDPRCS